VLAAPRCGAVPDAIDVPPGRAGSHEALLHDALGTPAVLPFGEERTGSWLARRSGHHAVGVVARPEYGPGGYVPTVMGARYDGLIWLEETHALEPLRPERTAPGPELGTGPTGVQARARVSRRPGMLRTVPCRVSCWRAACRRRPPG
jgi:hypothetical protein